ncbi:MAG: hypothetical protein ACYC7E_07615 [Armatimonadota bacterium]
MSAQRHPTMPYYFFRTGTIDEVHNTVRLTVCQGTDDLWPTSYPWAIPTDLLVSLWGCGITTIQQDANTGDRYTCPTDVFLQHGVWMHQMDDEPVIVPPPGTLHAQRPPIYRPRRARPSRTTSRLGCRVLGDAPLGVERDFLAKLPTVQPDDITIFCYQRDDDDAPHGTRMTAQDGRWQDVATGGLQARDGYFGVSYRARDTTAPIQAVSLCLWDDTDFPDDLLFDYAFHYQSLADDVQRILAFPPATDPVTTVVSASSLYESGDIYWRCTVSVRCDPVAYQQAETAYYQAQEREANRLLRQTSRGCCME